MIRYMKVKYLVLNVWAALFAMSCTQQPTFETRVEKILYEINDPESAYIVVASHRGEWRNYPENALVHLSHIERITQATLYTSYIGLIPVDHSTKDFIMMLAALTKFSFGKELVIQGVKRNLN